MLSSYVPRFTPLRVVSETRDGASHLAERNEPFVLLHYEACDPHPRLRNFGSRGKEALGNEASMAAS